MKDPNGVERDSHGKVTAVPDGYAICPGCGGTGGYRPMQIECSSCHTKGFIKSQ